MASVKHDWWLCVKVGFGIGVAQRKRGLGRRRPRQGKHQPRWWGVRERLSCSPSPPGFVTGPLSCRQIRDDTWAPKAVLKVTDRTSSKPNQILPTRLAMLSNTRDKKKRESNRSHLEHGQLHLQGLGAGRLGDGLHHLWSSNFLRGKQAGPQVKGLTGLITPKKIWHPQVEYIVQSYLCTKIHCPEKNPTGVSPTWSCLRDPSPRKGSTARL